MSYVDRIRWQCRIRPREPALALPGADRRIVTYDELDAALNNAGRRLRELAIVPGAVYALLVKDPLLQLVLALALDELRAASMVIYDLKLPKAWPFATILSDRDRRGLPMALRPGRRELVARRRPPLPRVEAVGSTRRYRRVVLDLRLDRHPEGRGVHAWRRERAHRQFRLCLRRDRAA